MKILLIDNNDSFTRNLEHLLAAEITDADIEVCAYEDVLGEHCGKHSFSGYDLLVVSPGPGCPDDYPGYATVFESGKPVLGVCLGMQIMNEYFGGKTDRLAGCCHGRGERINFANRELVVARYHSLFCSSIAPELRVISRNSTGVPMVLVHSKRSILGYQFHPESFLTEKPGEFIRYALEFFQTNQL